MSHSVRPSVPAWRGVEVDVRPDGRSVSARLPFSTMRYRCNLGVWVLAAFMVLPLAVIHLLGPAFIAVSSAFGG